MDRGREMDVRKFRLITRVQSRFLHLWTDVHPPAYVPCAFLVVFGAGWVPQICLEECANMLRDCEIHSPSKSSCRKQKAQQHFKIPFKIYSILNVSCLRAGLGSFKSKREILSNYYYCCCSVHYDCVLFDYFAVSPSIASLPHTESLFMETIHSIGNINRQCLYSFLFCPKSGCLISFNFVFNTLFLIEISRRQYVFLVASSSVPIRCLVSK